MTRKNDLEVVRNPNYTIAIKDGKGKQMLFRDICGADLEFLESVVSSEDGPRQLSYDDVISILELISLNLFDFKNLPQRISLKVFEKIKEHILLNYMPKYTWLSRCYGIQNGSFMGVLEMEKVPMTKFMAMTQIHQDAIESLNKNPE
jgi:hypothetical protein